MGNIAASYFSALTAYLTLIHHLSLFCYLQRKLDPGKADFKRLDIQLVCKTDSQRERLE